MTTKILRARLLAKDINNSPIEVKFYNENLVSIQAGTLTKDLASTKDVLFSRRDGRGQLPFKSTYENGAISLNYVVSLPTMAEIRRVRHKINLLSQMLKEGRGVDIDELVKLEYELPNDLSKDTKTRQGQHKRYAIVLDITETDNGSMSDTGKFNGGTNLLSDPSIQITCLPFAYGIKDKFGYTDSAIMATRGGTLIGNLNDVDTITNYIFNPSFSADTLMENWTYNPAELQIERLREEQSLLDNDILVTNLTNSISYVETSIADTGDFFLFVLSKRFDGGTGGVLLSLNGDFVSISTGITESPFGDYFISFASFTAIAPFTCGFSVFGNSQIIVAHAQLTKGNLNNEYPYPFIANGDMLGHKWQGTPHASKSEIEYSIKDGVIYKDVDWLRGNFTINIWVTPLWEKPLNGVDAQVFKYDTLTFGSVECKIRSLFLGSPFLEISATGYTSETVPITVEYNTPIMLTFVKGGVGAFRVWVNGALALGALPALQERDLVAGGTFEIGKQSNMIFDGFKIFDTDLTQNDIANLYNDEVAIKNKGEAISNGIPCFYAYPQGQIGGMDGYNVVSSVQVDTRNYITLLGATGDGSSDVNLRLESIDSISTNRIVLNTISNYKQFIYNGNFYLNFQGSDEDDPLNGYAVDMASISPRVVAGAFPKNSLQPGETFEAVFEVGKGGQAVYNVYPLATQRPKLLNGKVSILVRLLHTITPASSLITSRPIFSYGGDAKEIAEYKEVGDIPSSGSGDFVQFAYSGFLISLKNFDTIGKDNLVLGFQFKNDDTVQSFLALDTIHIVKEPKIYQYEGLTLTGQSLVLTTNKPALVEDSDGFAINRGSSVSQEPLVVMPDNYVYLGVDFTTYTFNDRQLKQHGEVRKRSLVDLGLTPTYKF